MDLRPGDGTARLADRGSLTYIGAGIAIDVPPGAGGRRFGMISGKHKLAQPDPDDVPKAVINRLSLYLRELQHLLRNGKTTISSSQLGRLFGFTDAQVRKDLTCFGQFGHPGIGYRCEELVVAIRRILGTDRVWTVALFGVGNLGRALLGYKGFSAKGFQIVAAFDADPHKVGSMIDGVCIEPMDRLDDVVARQQIQLAMITVPAAVAQAVADLAIEAGVAGIVNFAPVTLSVPDDVSLVGVDLATELEQISFSVANRDKSG